MLDKFRTPVKGSRIPAVAAGLIVLFAFCSWSFDPASLPPASNEVLKGHVRYLASGPLTGRGVDTPGIQLAANYIAKEFARYGLRGGGDLGTFRQSFEVVTGVSVRETSALKIADRLLRLNEEWMPLGISDSGKVEADLVFAGYGITVKDYGYDDYRDIDAKGKIVLVLRYEPPPIADKGPFRALPRYSRYATLRAKVDNARAHGAVGMILVDLNHTGDDRKELLSTRGSLWRGDGRIMAAQVKRRVLESWLQPRAITLAELKNQIDRDHKPASFAIPGAKVSIACMLDEMRTPTENVVGILPGAEGELKDETIVVGAHFDHLGLGPFGSRDASAEGQTHHGADDNASGTAVLMEVARRLSRANPGPARTVVFVAFSGEELGLHGSRRYVDRPPLSLSSTVAMLNLDMVGRLRDNRLIVNGARSSPVLRDTLRETAAQLRFEMVERDEVGRSDHLSFYNKRIPVAHLMTGVHEDYHLPSDTWDKLNMEGMARISDLVALTVEKLAATRAPREFVSLPSRSDGGRTAAPGGFDVYLGSIPDYGTAVGGVKLAGVSPGSPAAAAGLREGDVIVQFAGAKIENLDDLTAQLGKRKPGDEVEIVVLRGREPVAFKAILAARG